MTIQKTNFRQSLSDKDKELKVKRYLLINSENAALFPIDRFFRFNNHPLRRWIESIGAQSSYDTILYVF